MTIVWAFAITSAVFGSCNRSLISSCKPWESHGINKTCESPSELSRPVQVDRIVAQVTSICCKTTDS
jgi:hypothetical protein